MSTRSIIARYVARTDGFEGRYHHSDGYPRGVGAELFKLYNGFFKRDLEKMLKVLLDDHPAGWSSIIDADFRLKPCWIEPFGRKFNRKTFEYMSHQPICYCHGARHYDDYLITPETSTDCEWAYIINVKTHKMYINKVDMGMGCSDIHHNIEEVDLDGPEPDWADIEHRGYTA